MNNFFGRSSKTAEQIIFRKKEVRQLYGNVGFGKENRYNSGNFDPLTRNLRTGKTLTSTHHCDYCTKKMTHKCYDDLHYGFCVTWVSRVDSNGQPLRVMCGERFSLRSGGCGKHPRVQGHNEPLYKIATHQPVFWSDFDDKNLLGSGEAVQDHTQEVEEDLLWEVIGEIAVTGREHSDDIAINFWEGKKIEDEYRHRDELKTRRRTAKVQKSNKGQDIANHINKEQESSEARRNTFMGSATRDKALGKTRGPAWKNKSSRALTFAPMPANTSQKREESPEVLKQRIRQTIARD